MSAYSRRKPSICTCPHWCQDCQIEKCPERPGLSFLPGTLHTEYLDQYVKKQVPYGRQTRTYETGPSQPFKGTSLYSSDYHPHRHSPQKPPAKESSPGPRTVPFTGQSSYRTDFVPKKANLAHPSKPKEDEWKAPFYGSTTNRDNFRDWGVLTPPSKTPEIASRGVPFEGSTTYRDDYTRKQASLTRPRSAPPEEQSLNRPNYTTYGRDYVPKPLPAKKKKGCCDDHTHTSTRPRTL
jgi:hypothetical protein